MIKLKLSLSEHLFLKKPVGWNQQHIHKKIQTLPLKPLDIIIIVSYLLMAKIKNLTPRTKEIFS